MDHISDGLEFRGRKIGRVITTMPGLPFPLASWLQGAVPDTTLQVALWQNLLFGGSTWPANADFFEATYDGYARQNVQQINPATDLGNGYIYWQTQTMRFATAPSNRVANIIAGWFMSAVGGEFHERVIAWGVISPSKDMSNPDVSLTFAPAVTVLTLTTPRATS